MYFCQDCGGANAATATTCRICGKALAQAEERTGPPCQRCGGATADHANFCSLCGAATVQVASGQRADAQSASNPTDSVINTAHQPVDDATGMPINLGEGLELPDWLKRAAAEQPFDASRQTALNANPFGPAGGSTATLAPSQPGDDLLLSPQSAPSSIPTGSDTVVSQRAAGSDDAALRVAAAKPPADNVTDTASFISEDDLPEWIRQLAAADEAKKLEEQRRAEEAAASTRLATPEPRTRKPLPGETASSGPATNPWLARRERTDQADTAANPWGAARPAQPPIAEDQPLTASASTPERAARDLAAAPEVVKPMPAPASEPNRLRLYLIAAVVLVVVVMVAMMTVL